MGWKHDPLMYAYYNTMRLDHLSSTSQPTTQPRYIYRYRYTCMRASSSTLAGSIATSWQQMIDRGCIDEHNVVVVLCT